LQDDNFIPAMTVRETLTFCADVTLPASDSSVRGSRVEEVLAAMGLAAAGHTLVSGGDLKALLLGVTRVMYSRQHHSNCQVIGICAQQPTVPCGILDRILTLSVSCLFACASSMFACQQ
jgi:hypothetical protein